MVPAAMVPPRKKGGTQPIPQVDADAMRNRLADAYVK
jgi:hypothetical protein